MKETDFPKSLENFWKMREVAPPNEKEMIDRSSLSEEWLQFINTVGKHAKKHLR